MANRQSIAPPASKECPLCGNPVPKKRLGQRGNQRKYCSQCKPPQSQSVPIERPCVECGEIIPRSGKRGPLRTRCNKCQPRDRQGSRITPPREQQCVGCQRWFVGRKRKFCSKECRQIRRTMLHEADRECPTCGIEFKPTLPKHRFCTRACGIKYRNQVGIQGVVCNCKRCGKEFHPKAHDRTTFCSRECAYSYLDQHGHYGEPREAQRRVTARAIADGMLHCLKRWRECKACGCRFYSRTATGQYCSDLCCPSTYVVVPVKLVCMDCGKEWERTGRGSHAKRCKRCNKRRAKNLYGNGKHSVRAKLLGVAYETVHASVVFKRDRWKCGICGKKTSKSKQVPHKRAPTLDHIIPMSKGGGHLYSNVQCACFECNSNASNNMAGKQLRLV
jgi:hypothetical protein